MKLTTLAALAGLGALLLQQNRKGEAALIQNIVAGAKHDLSIMLARITNRNGEEIRRFTENLNSPANPAAADFPEIEHIELTFRRTAEHTTESILSVAYRKENQQRVCNANRTIDEDFIPGNLMEQLICSKEKMVTFSLYRKEETFHG